MAMLNRLFTLAEASKTSADVVKRMQVPVRADYLQMLEELAEEIGLSRAAVARECLERGVQTAYGEWEEAKKAAAAEKKAAKQQQKLKLEGGEEK
jgi:hypothetical protein